MDQKENYWHQNPVEEGLVFYPEGVYFVCKMANYHMKEFVR